MKTSEMEIEVDIVHSRFTILLKSNDNSISYYNIDVITIIIKSGCHSPLKKC